MTLGLVVISNKADKLEKLLNWAKDQPIIDKTFVLATVNDPFLIDIAKEASDYRVKEITYPEEGFAYLLSIVDTDWVLRLDDDEILQRGFETSVSAVMNTQVTSTWIPRKWLYTSEQHYIHQAPWYPDYQIRLWKLGFIEPASQLHTHSIPKGPTTSLDTFILHDTLFTLSYEDRRRKCEYYAKGMGISDIQFRGSVLGTFYLPEDHIGDLDIRSVYEDTGNKT